MTLRFSALRISCRILIPVSLGLLVVCADSGFASADPNPELAGFEGEWTLVDPAENRIARMTAIDRAIEGLSWVVRKMAGPILRRSITPPPRMQFVWDGQKLEQRVIDDEGEHTRQVEFDIEKHQGIDNRGKPLFASWAWTDSGLQLSWQQDQAYGQNLYRVDRESGNLIIRHTIQITAISNVEPIVFESRMGRNGSPAVSASLESKSTKRAH